MYASLGIGLPGGGLEAKVRCFVAPEAHKHDDRDPSCSVNRDTGMFCCFTCGAKGGPYDAAVALGRRPADAMTLLREHGLHVGGGGGCVAHPPARVCTSA